MDQAARPSQTAAASLEAAMLALGRTARAAQHEIGLADSASKNAALHNAAKLLRSNAMAIGSVNRSDVAAARERGQTDAFLDRMTLDAARIEAIAVAVEQVAELPDPVGRLLARFIRPNGLVIERVATPLGVIGVIFESRPNVTADAAALCLKAGNAVILRAGSESLQTSLAIAEAMRGGCRAAGLPENAVQIVPIPDRGAVGHMLSGLGGALDVIVPRGGKSLVARVESEARVPVFAHLEGVCHVYVHADADPAMAMRIVVNAKLRRTGVCGAAETLLIDRACVDTHARPILTALAEAGCALRGDATVCAIEPRATPASEDDWRTEYLAPIIAVRVVNGLDAAIRHIETHGSHHTDAIVTGDAAAAERFLNEVDSAIVLHNASTQFADGGEFGFGAEIGIATGRMHARGPVGVEQLTSFNYRVRGNGQIRA